VPPEDSFVVNGRCGQHLAVPLQWNVNLYCYADIMIDSPWPLGELPPADTGASDKPAIVINLLDAPAPEPAESDWIHRWSPEVRKYGRLSLALSGNGENLLLRFPGLADFLISKDGRRIEVWSAPATEIESLRHLLLDQVLPRVLAQQGRPVLHAGAVQVGDQAIAFTGGSGSGKSTLTASFDAVGYPLLSDDGLVLTHGEDTTLALSTYSSLRLWPESIANLYTQPPTLASVAHYSSKRRITLSDPATNTNIPLPLASLYVLGSVAATDDAGISLNRLSAREACMAIIGNSFQLDVTDRRRVTDAFANASRIADHLPVFSIAYPRDFARLPEVHEAILRGAANKPLGGKKDMTQ
jgi:hypothetical protein